MLRVNKFDRGDTIVEVMFAIAIFGLVSVGALSIMNQSTITAQRALEITMVRQQIDAQAETLRFLNASYVAAYRPGLTSYPLNTPAGQWHRISTNGVTLASSVSDFEDLSACKTAVPTGSFVLNTKNAKAMIDSAMNFSKASEYARVVHDGSDVFKKADGIWIEAIKSSVSASTSGAGYIDFHIRACWDSPGGDAMPLKLGTIVRLYEPR